MAWMSNYIPQNTADIITYPWLISKDFNKRNLWPLYHIFIPHPYFSHPHVTSLYHILISHLYITCLYHIFISHPYKIHKHRMGLTPNAVKSIMNILEVWYGKVSILHTLGTGGLIQYIEISSYRCWKSHCGDKMILQLSYLPDTI